MPSPAPGPDARSFAAYRRRGRHGGATVGGAGGARIDAGVRGIGGAAARDGDIAQSDEIGEAMLSLRGFMFDRVYLGPHVEAEHRRARDVVQAIFERLVAEPERLPPGHGELADRVTDYLAGMTDRFALAYAAEL